MRVISDDKCQQLLSLGALLPNAEDADDEDMVISTAEVAGAYVLLVLSDGAAILLQHQQTTGERMSSERQRWLDAQLHPGDCETQFVSPAAEVVLSTLTASAELTVM